MAQKKSKFLENLFIDTLCSTAYFEVKKTVAKYMDLMRSSLLFETVYRDDSGDVFCLQKQFSSSQGFQCFIMRLNIPLNINFPFEHLCLTYWKVKRESEPDL